MDIKMIALATAILTAFFVQAKTVELTVDSDTTLSAALDAAGATLGSGDTLVKKGVGKLTSDIVFANEFDLTVKVSNGVLEVTAPGQLGYNQSITVENGATLLVTTIGEKIFVSRRIKLSGTGAPGYNGALVLDGAAHWEVMNYVTFELQADAAIAIKAKGQWGLFSHTTLSMNNHVLTLVGDVASAVPEFRFRKKATINQAGGVVLRNASLTSTSKSDGEHSCNPTVPYLKMDATSKFSSGTADGMFLGCFSSYIAEYGATITIPNWGQGVSKIEGAPTVGDGVKSVLQVNKTYIAHAEDLLSGHCFNSSSSGMRFGNTSSSSVVFEMDDWSRLVGGSTIYTVASAVVGKGIAYYGSLSITNTNVYAAHWSLDKTSDPDKLLLKWSANAPEGVVSVTEWGLEPGEANKAGNAEKFNKGVANLADGATLWFPVGDWYFDGPVTMPDENNEKKINIELEAGLAKLHYYSAEGVNDAVRVNVQKQDGKTEIVIGVEYGATVTVDEALAVADFKDWPQDASLIKRGSGRLVASDVIREAVGHIYVCEGVLQASKNGDLGKDSDKKYEIRVYNGASLLLTPENNDTIIIKERNLKIEGAGNRGLKVPGALAFDKKFSYQVIYNSSIELENDTVISSTGTASQNGLFSYVTLNMNSHKMILTCDDEKVAHFRFRFGRMIENAGTIVLDRAKLSSTDHKISINPSDTLVVELVHGGELAPYRASFYDEIASIICTSGRISTDSANLDVTLKDVSGPLTIDSKVTATITGAFGVKASDIVNGKVLTAEKALTFARGSYLALEKDIDLPAIIEGRPAVYRVASSAVGITGGLRTRGLTFGGCRYRTAVAEDAKSLELVQAGGLCVTLR